MVTLIPTEEWVATTGADAYDATFVWGAVYEIDPKYADAVRENLDVRERDGYSIESVDVFHVVDGKEEAWTHVGTIMRC